MAQRSSSWRASRPCWVLMAAVSLFIHLFLPAPLRAVLVNSPLLLRKDYRSLAEEAERVLLATESFTVQSVSRASPARCAEPPVASSEAGDSSVMARIVTQRQPGSAFCFYHQRFDAKACRYLLNLSKMYSGSILVGQVLLDVFTLVP